MDYGPVYIGALYQEHKCAPDARAVALSSSWAGVVGGGAALLRMRGGDSSHPMWCWEESRA
jgi:hypothetical protein